MQHPLETVDTRGPSAAPINAATIAPAISQALHLGPPPPYDELVALEQTLLLAIPLLYAPVDEAVAQMSLVSADRRRLRARLDSVRRQTAVGLGHGLMSAQMQVRALARDCQWLLNQRTTEARR